ncbi:hypothetical protein [Fictibacillus phosphorivorans]|uniref:hypothetical protein n=1 Tax=Fictibacillus phosphorivorans TaxID=1221500 RepID=UPI0012939D73|nr:hypothetical protein [Fictibacillus phosphorivorans]MQR93682.1 hypothetical protein [Fictibacillus phosphorivorans]
MTKESFGDIAKKLAGQPTNSNTTKEPSFKSKPLNEGTDFTPQFKSTTQFFERSIPNNITETDN